ncbi:unnamed protein product, partial [Cyprideis torosa]
VFFSWPDPNKPPSWQYLGFISNDKPSAIFRITRLKSDLLAPSAIPRGFGTAVSHTAQIGVALERMHIIQGNIPQVDSEPSKVSCFQEFSQKMLENFVNFVSSFSVTQSQMTSSPFESFVPLSQVQNWYQGFRRRLEIDPYFWQK